MPTNAVPQGIEPQGNDAANFEGGTSYFQTQGGVPLTSGQIKNGADTRWARSEYRDSDADATNRSASLTGKSGFGGHSGPSGQVVTWDVNKNSGKTAG